MDNIKQQSLADLEKLYKQKLDHWEQRRREFLEKARECEQQTNLYEEKLRHIQALVGVAPPSTPVVSTTPNPKPGAPVGGRRQHRRKSPIRDATLIVLRNRPGQHLTAGQIKTAIRKDTHRRGSRQAVNNAVNALVKEGLIQRVKAPKGTGSQFAYVAK